MKAKVKSITINKEKSDVFDITVEDNHNFVANGVVLHNSEQWLDPHNVCLLSSINLAKFYEYGNAKYLELIDAMIHLLDAFRMYEIEEERSPSKLQMEKLEKLPRIGLGVTGFADYLINSKIPYGSDISIGMADYIFSKLASQSYVSSYWIARNRGYSFEYYDKEKYRLSPFVQNLLKKGLINEFHLDYQAHVCKTTVAPNGTLSEVVEAGGGGIEPIFGKYYVRRERATTQEWKEWFTYNHAVRRVIQKEGLELTRENVEKVTQGKEWVTAHTVDNLQKIKLMATIQQYVDSAMSVTYNLPETATSEDIEAIYFEAWNHNLKAVSVYREGSKFGVLITDANYEATKKRELSMKTSANRFSPERPEYVECDIYKVTVQKVPYIVLVGTVEGKPYEVFVTHMTDDLEPVKKYKKGIIQKVKKGYYSLIIENGETKTMVDNIAKSFDEDYGTLGRFISMSLRHGVPLEFVVDQLAKDENFAGFEKSVGRIMKKYIKDETIVKTSDVCPDCSGQLMYKEGCKTCTECGWSKCD